MQLRDAIQDFMLECKVRRLVPRTIDNYGKHLRYLIDSLSTECWIEKPDEVKSAQIKKVPPDEGGTGMQTTLHVSLFAIEKREGLS